MTDTRNNTSLKGISLPHWKAKGFLNGNAYLVRIPIEPAPKTDFFGYGIDANPWTWIIQLDRISDA